MIRAALIALLLVGCAHAETKLAAPNDDRAVLVELCAPFYERCQLFERDYRPDPSLQRALAAVRVVRYDVDTISGSNAYERLVGSPMSGMSTVGGVIWAHRVPLFLGVVDDRVVRRLEGLPDRESVVAFVEGVAELGGSESALGAALAAAPDDTKLLARAGRWYDVHRRPDDALKYWNRLGALVDAPADLRAEADWQRGRRERKGHPREPRALLAFADSHAGTRPARDALAVAAVLKLEPAEVSAALRVNYEASRGDGEKVHQLVYHALAAHQYDLALEFAQELVRRTQQLDPVAFDALADVYYYRHQPDVAIATSERALALAPQSPYLRAQLERFRRADGSPSDRVEKVRSLGLQALPDFYGDRD
jgi:tetratricopeptide (TPR) repeat protein